MGAWLVGVLLGYALFKTKQKRMRLSKTALIIGWSLTLLISTVIMFGTYPLHQLDYHGPIILDALCDSTFRVVWSSCLAWIIFTCIHGYGGFVNRFLCLEVWQPLGKLSYSAYLLHYPIQVVLSGSRRGPLYFSDFTTLERFGGDVLISFGAALVWVLLLEMPVIGLDRILLRPKRVGIVTGSDIETDDREKLCSENC